MAVIINDFEIVPEAAGKQEGVQGDAKPDAQPLPPVDIQAAMAHARRRELRVRAD